MSHKDKITCTSSVYKQLDLIFLIIYYQLLQWKDCPIFTQIIIKVTDMAYTIVLILFSGKHNCIIIKFVCL